ncbi:MAG: phosphoribosyl-ATP diphosphatase [Planctomycetota bacterium]
MIIPSIDLEGGRTVQLVGGEELAIDAGDPRAILERFSVVGEVAVIDLDAAKGEGSNRELIRELCRLAPVRVGGGIRDVDTALEWLDAGAQKVILGTAADPELLRQLPRDRVLVALDTKNGEVVTHGWRRGTGRSVLGRIAELREFCAGFLVTFVDLEGRLAGTDLEQAERIAEAASGRSVTIAGGVTTADEVAALDQLGLDAQVGMALYSDRLGLGEAFASPLRSDREDGLWPTVVTDERGQALGLCYSSANSLREAIESRRGVYQSRRRGLWVKGESSGATQELLKVEVDCDRDALRFTVRQAGPGFCHLEQPTCFGEDQGLGRLERRLEDRRRSADPSSNTRRLFDDPQLWASKMREEAGELVDAVTLDEIRHEAADVLYFLMVKLAASGVSMCEVEAELDRRELRVTRRVCERKERR